MANREHTQNERTTYRRMPSLWRTEKDRVNGPSQSVALNSPNRQREIHGSAARVDCWVRDLD